MNLYIVSEKQGSGKTFITAGLAATMQSLGYSTGCYKPIQTGAKNQNGFLSSEDITFIKKIDPNINTAVSYLFETETIPLLASKKEENPIQPEILVKDFLTMKKTAEIILVEGYNGIITPIAENIDTSDFVKAIQTSVLIVTESSREALEKVLLMINYAQHSGLRVCGVIINKYIHSSDIYIKNLPSMIEMYSGIPVVGLVNYQTKITPYGLIDTMLHSVDLETIFDMNIPKLNNPDSFLN